MKMLLCLQALASLNMMGLIWCIQWLHYPMFRHLPKHHEFSQTLKWHGRRITWLVAPWMLLELLCASWLLAFPPWPSPLFGWGFALVCALWLSTGLLQVPLHGRLCKHYHLTSLNRLIASNWIRTALWSLRGMLSLFMLATYS